MSLLDFINTQKSPDPQRLGFIKLTPELILDLLKIGDGVTINGERITITQDPIPDDAKTMRVGVDEYNCINLIFASDTMPQIPEGGAIPRITPWFNKERTNENRKDVLLRATYDILKRCDDGPYVKSPFEVCARWDDANCDGECLMEEIADLLRLEENEPPIPLEEDEE